MQPSVCYIVSYLWWKSRVKICICICLCIQKETLERYIRNKGQWLPEGERVPLELGR